MPTAACPAPTVLLHLRSRRAQAGLADRPAGYTWGRALFYVKGGLAAGEVTAGTLHSNNTGLQSRLCHAALAAHATGQTAGPLGGGMEFALTDRWSAKAEYMHYDLG